MFTVESVTNPGGRERNEDAYGCQVVNGTTCWVVADGLGGSAGGDAASRIAVDAVIESFQQNPALDGNALRSHLQHAHEAIVARQCRESERSQMKSTLIVLVSDGWKAIWAHVGDSRLYHIRAGKIAFRTRDHSVAQMKVDAGDLHASQFHQDPDRNKLLRAAGISGEFTPTVRTEPEFLARGDAFLLCVDGFWDKVMDTEVEIDFAKSMYAKDWLDAMGRRLYQRLSPDADNFTAIAIRTANPDLPQVGLEREDASGGEASVLARPVRRLILAVLITVGISSLLAIRLIRPYIVTARLPAPSFRPSVTGESPARMSKPDGSPHSPTASPNTKPSAGAGKAGEATGHDVPRKQEVQKEDCANIQWLEIEERIANTSYTGNLSLRGQQLIFATNEGDSQTFNLKNYTVNVVDSRLDLHSKTRTGLVSSFRFKNSKITPAQKACLVKSSDGVSQR